MTLACISHWYDKNTWGWFSWPFDQVGPTGSVGAVEPGGSSDPDGPGETDEPGKITDASFKCKY